MSKVISSARNGRPFKPSSPTTSQLHHTSRGQITTAYALPDVFSNIYSKLSKQPNTKTTIRKTRDELLSLLVSGSGEEADVSRLVDMLAGSNLPFQEKLLSGGPWVVRYTRGGLTLWNATYSPGKLLNGDNRASQDLEPKGRTVVNKAEYFGNHLYVTASGTYEPLVTGSKVTMPVPVQANIQAGNIHIFGKDIYLPIRGTGEFDILYLDDCLRVFRSGNTLAVQVKETLL